MPRFLDSAPQLAFEPAGLAAPAGSMLRSGFRRSDVDVITPIRPALSSRCLCGAQSPVGAAGPAVWGRRTRAVYDPARPAAQYRGEWKAGLDARHTPAGWYPWPYHESRRAVSGP